VFGLDEAIAGLSHEGAVGLVVLVALLLGARHATDPDHIVAVAALFASGRDRAARAAGWLGVAWGLGHGLTLLAFGVPLLLFRASAPEAVQRGLELAVAAVIVVLALRLIVRWRRGRYPMPAQEHAGDADSSDALAKHGATRASRPRRLRGAFGVGVLHGVGGSGGATVLVLASVESRALAIMSLALLALFTIPSMCLITTGLGAALVRRPAQVRMDMLLPVLATLTLGYGLWYGAGVIEAGIYPF
jgi:ABC-type nickel/cobalt efflux system permease component RcnA